MEHVVAQRSSLKQWDQYWNRETMQGEKRKQRPLLVGILPLGLSSELTIVQLNVVPTGVLFHC